jgi:drug/metabolite transporter (DMT)-like permease
MAGSVFVVVLAAALLHASWNAIAKAIPDRWVAAGLFGAAGLIPAGIGAATLPLPQPDSWPYIVASSLLSASYLILLMHAYHYGEFSQIYPLARGLPPLLVALFALVMLGERLNGGQLAGVALVSVALTMLVFAGGRPRPGSGLGLAAATGVLIAMYTALDGAGVRQSGHTLSYAMWRFLLEAPLLVGISWAMSGTGFWRAAARSASLGLLGGLLAMAAFAAVVWAQATCTPGVGFGASRD